MKKLLLALLLLVSVVTMCGCFEASLSDEAKEEITEMVEDAYYDGYNDGYREGYDAGYIDGQAGTYNNVGP